MRNDKAFFALHRYYISANQMRRDFDRLCAEAASIPNGFGYRSVELNIYMSYWYAGLFVVIEGWKRLNLIDEEIDQLLSDKEKIILLENFRHYVYHYYPDYFDDKYVNLINNGAEIVPWIRKLWKSLGRYFLQELPRGRKHALGDTKQVSQCSSEKAKR